MNVISPQIIENLSRTLARASDDGVRVSPRGGNSSQDKFLQATHADLIVDLRQFTRVIEYEPANLTASVEAGMTLAALQNILREHHQWLPLDPPQPERATIGGIVAANAHGPMRLRYGTLRDWLLGARVVLADGTIIHGGGKVVKNVAGYDLPKLFVGSFGTLGVIVEATFKLSPLPELTRTLRAQFSSHSAALNVMLAIAHWSVLPNAMELLDPLATQHESDAFTLLVQLGGARASVERQTRDSEALCQQQNPSQLITLEGAAEADAWRRVRDLPATLGEADITLLEWRLLPSQLDDAISHTYALAQQQHLDCTLFVRALQALWIALRGDDANVSALVAQLRARATEHKGHLVVQRMPPSLAGSVDVWGAPRADFVIMQRLKAQFDPHNILNPGLLVGGL